jgi:hypothetical protein
LDTGVLTALVSGSAAILVAAVTYALTKRREHEAAWRDLKLKHYQEYVAALSAVVGGRATADNRARYADAGNKLSLVAPPGFYAPSTIFRMRFPYEVRHVIARGTT